MSKHKKKNNRRKTTQKPTAPQKKPIPWLTITLIAISVILAVAVALVIWKPWQTETEPTPEPRATEQYLENKYKRNFEYYTTVSGGLDLYTTPGVDGLISVGPTQTFVTNYGYDAKLLDENYADNAYPMLKAKEIEEYYAKNLGSACGKYRILMDFGAAAFPNDMTMEMPVETAMKKYPDYMVPTLFVLTDQKPNQVALDAITKSFEDSGDSLLLRMAYATEAAQKVAELDAVALSWSQNKNVLLNKDINIDWEE
jgi:hypothetical protein